MFRANSRVKLNLGKIRRLSQAAIISLEETAEALHTEVVQAQVIPFDTGNLQNESFFVDAAESGNGKVALVHSTPYARRLYFHPEFRFSKEENPDARGKWFEEWTGKGEKSDFAPQTFAECYRRNTGT